MPCLVINTETSTEVVPTNVPFNGAEMCGIIIRSLPQDWQTQYRVVNGPKNQTKIRPLILDLEAIEKVIDQKRKEKDTLTDSCTGTVLVQFPTLTVNISVNIGPIKII